MPRDRLQPVNGIVAAAALVILIAGIRAAAAIVVPFLLAIFIAVLCAPLVFRLTARKMPTAAAVLLVISAVLGAGALIGGVVSASIDDFSQRLPAYRQSLRAELEAPAAWVEQLGLERYGIEVSFDALGEIIDPAAAMDIAGNALREIGSFLTNMLLILLTVIFILLEASGFRAKLEAAFGGSRPTFSGFDAFAGSVKHYLAIKTAVSLLTGLAVVLWLWILGVDFPVLWGLFAFLFNYIPNIGSIIAAVPAVLLAFIQYGAGTALLAAGGYVAVNVFVGNFIEPKFMGQGLGLSPLVVFLSLVFWGWLLGTVGMLLSIPLTITVKIALESNPDTRWAGILLGPSKT